MPSVQIARRDVGDPVTSGYDFSCEGPGIGYILQKLNGHLSSISVRLVPSFLLLSFLMLLLDIYGDCCGIEEAT